MIDVGGLFTLALLGVWIYAVFDVIVSDKETVRNLPKWAWLLIVVLFMALGAVAWFFLGRPSRLFQNARLDPNRTFGTPRETPPRRPRPTRAQRAEEEAEIEANIAKREQLMAQWAEEDRRKTEGGSPS